MINKNQTLKQKFDIAMVEEQIDYSKDGTNFREGIVRRGYLRSDEMNNFMMIYTAQQLIDGVRSIHRKAVPYMWETWCKRSIMTKEQQKNLKMANTYLSKFVADVYNNNFDIKTKNTVAKKAARWELKLIDDFTVKKLYSMLNDMKEVQVDLDTFYDLVEAKMEMSCKGCTKNRCECDTHAFFESKLVPPINEGSECNCEYSYLAKGGE